MLEKSAVISDVERPERKTVNMKRTIAASDTHSLEGRIWYTNQTHPMGDRNLAELGLAASQICFYLWATISFSRFSWQIPPEQRSLDMTAYVNHALRRRKEENLAWGSMVTSSTSIFTDRNPALGCMLATHLHTALLHSCYGNSYALIGMRVVLYPIRVEWENKKAKNTVVRLVLQIIRCS